MFIKGIIYWSFVGRLEGTKPVAKAFPGARKAEFKAICFTSILKRQRES